MSVAPDINVWTLGKGARGQWKLGLTAARRDAGAAHGPHGMHGVLAAVIILGFVGATGAGAIESTTIPTAAAGVAAPLCAVGQPCTFAAAVFACDYAGAERIAAAGPAVGSEVGAGLVRTQTCQIVPPGRPLGTEATKSGQVVDLTEGGQHLGYTPVGVFAPPGTATQGDNARPRSDASSQGASPPLRDTAVLADIAIGEDRAPDAAAVEIRAQGTNTASGVFRTGPAERRKFCRANWEERTAALRGCLTEPDAAIIAKADCEARRVTLNGRRYGLFERPGNAGPDIHLDEHRAMHYRDLQSGEWLDGSTRSGETSVRTAFNALCPGVDPAASFGLVYRDPQARYPRELWGRWYSDPQACTDPQRNRPDYDEYVWFAISERTDRSRESKDTLSAIRQVSRNAWVIDANSPSHEDTPNYFSQTYTLTRNGLIISSGEVRRGDRASPWVRCAR